MWYVEIPKRKTPFVGPDFSTFMHQQMGKFNEDWFLDPPDVLFAKRDVLGRDRMTIYFKKQEGYTLFMITYGESVAGYGEGEPRHVTLEKTDIILENMLHDVREQIKILEEKEIEKINR